uniref:(California timema) hypothetical protein n=1 Tax=Timema californicum TaxID=61474 RepID=A0A7R9JCX9_TIMCA|nr:unnamed protein product [Timema californicum]
MLKRLIYMMNGICPVECRDYIEELYPHLRGGKRKTVLSTPDRDPNPNHPVIGTPVDCKNDALSPKVRQEWSCAMEETDTSTTTKVSDSAYSNSCNSKSQRSSESSKSRLSNSSGSSGYGDNPSTLSSR